jgi:hypothetical protein
MHPTRETPAQIVHEHASFLATTTRLGEGAQSGVCA